MRTEQILKQTLLLAGGVIMLMPFLWMISTSLEQGGFYNYVEAWNRVPFGTYFLNTLIVTSLTLVGVLITSSLAAYSFGTMEYPGRDKLFLLFLSKNLEILPLT